MRGVRRTTPLFIVCRRPGCGAVKAVRGPVDQRTRKYCSRRCSAMATQNIQGAWPKGIRAAVTKRRAAVVARVAGLTPLQAFRLGYVRGLQSKYRQVARWRQAQIRIRA